MRNLTYYIHDGIHIVQTGHVPDTSVPVMRQMLAPGMEIVFGDDPSAATPRPSKFHAFNILSMAWEDTRDDATKAFDDYTAIQAARRGAYPDLGDQLDALWKAMDAGTIPKVSGFYDTVKAVKDAHPLPAVKPSEPIRTPPKPVHKTPT